MAPARRGADGIHGGERGGGDGGVHGAADAPVHLDGVLAQVPVQHGVEPGDASRGQRWVGGGFVLVGVSAVGGILPYLGA